MLPLLWKLNPRQRRELLLGFMTQYEQQLFKKLIAGHLSYCHGFDKKKCIFVHIPKTAGISVCKGLFSVDAIGHMPLRYYQQALGAEKYTKYFKFAFVRNPWDRVFSAYSYFTKGGLSIQDQIWGQAFRKYSDFNDFISKWLVPENIELLLHFMPQSHFIRNAQGVMDLDYLGRYENLAEDYEYIRQRLGGNTLGHSNVSTNGKTYHKIYSKQSIEIVTRVYQSDIESLGYDFNSSG